MLLPSISSVRSTTQGFQSSGPTSPISGTGSTDLMDLANNDLISVHIILPKTQDNQGSRKDAGMPNGQTIKAFLIQDIGIGGSADWATPFDNIIGNLFGNVKNVVEDLAFTAANVAGNVFRRMGMGDPSTADAQKFVVQKQLKTKLQTIVSWTGSQTPMFRFSLIFPALKPGDDVRQVAKALLRCVFPIEPNHGESTAATIAKNFTLDAPLHYSPGSQVNRGIGDEGLTSLGTIAVFVGKWFRVFNCVARSVDVTFSKQMTPDGVPLLASVGLLIQPAMMWTTKDLEDIFPEVALGNAYGGGGDYSYMDEIPNQVQPDSIYRGQGVT